MDHRLLFWGFPIDVLC